MPQVVIVAKFKDPPVGTKKNWRMKDENGEVYSVPPAIASVIQQGSSYEVFYEESTFNNQVYKMVKSVKQVAQAAPAAVATAQRAGGGASQHDGKSEEIFVAMVVGRCIQAGLCQPTRTDMAATGKEARAAYKAIWWQNPQVAQSEEDMSDSIPF